MYFSVCAHLIQLLLDYSNNQHESTSLKSISLNFMKKFAVVQRNFIWHKAALGCEGFPTFRELVPETPEPLHTLTRLSARETFNELCRSESF